MTRNCRGRALQGLACSLLIAAGLVGQGCSNAGSAGTVGKAGEIELHTKEVAAIIDALPAETRAALAKDRPALERLVRGELLRRNLVEDAKLAKIDADPKVAEQLDRAHDDALVRAWLERQAKVSDDYPSEQDLGLAYQANVAALTPQPQYRVAQIFIAAPNGANPAALANALRKAAEVGSKIPGGDFAALAREYSEHAASAAQGGDVGMLPANQMLPEISSVVGDIAVGETIGPIKTSQGLHYLKLLDRKVPDAPTLDSVREQLKAALRARRAQELQQAYLTQLTAKLNVSVDQIALARLDKESK